MSPKSIAIAALGALTFGALMMLYLDVRAAPARPDEARITDARTRHKRVATPTAPVADPWAPAARTEPPAVAPDTRPPPAREPGVPGTVTPPPEPANEPDRAAIGRASLAAGDVGGGDGAADAMSAREEANRLYDRQDYEGAIATAEKVLSQAPGDIRMLRVVVSSSCQMGDADKAKKYWTQLPEHDKNQMSRRCQRFGITFAE